jgi:predicted nucleic acid-binding protein
VIWDLEKTKLSRKEYLDSLDPDNLNLSKQDLINFCHKCVDEWKQNKVGNFKFIVAMELIIAGVKITPEEVLKTVWKKILVWFWDLQFQNALEEEDGMLKRLREIGSG